MIVRHQLPEVKLTGVQDITPAYADHYLFTDSLPASFRYPEHFTALGIVAMLKGKGEFKINDETAALDENAFLIVNRGSRLSFALQGSDNIPVLLYFNTILCDLLIRAIFYRDVPADAERDIETYDFSLLEHIHFQHATLKNHLPWLINLGSSCSSFHALKADMLLRNLLDNIIAENYAAVTVSKNLDVVKQSTRKTLYKRLTVAKQWMEANCAAAFTIDHVADIAMLNTHHFLRLFKKAFRTTPHQYLIDLRIKRASNLLIATDSPVSEICQDVGFESLSSFSTLFKVRCGMSPTQFRELNRAQVEK
ncbi:AraC family transcriptional regulator [Fulvivirgaceae bacterium PWU4]|uniref:AraC family transcriptional regulator n=1 Tax=Chryseosolibacter histidini TaxID=2782349 RepID=A0AAP2DLI4_9BACT|nr:AraC family transcriptional regulator [Chryseosolibacter histidini]MBT1697337.1 AraC family transcriptional regulator [Chryseosolibacter histidini]